MSKIEAIQWDQCHTFIYLFLFNFCFCFSFVHLLIFFSSPYIRVSTINKFHVLYTFRLKCSIRYSYKIYFENSLTFFCCFIILVFFSSAFFFVDSICFHKFTHYMWNKRFASNPITILFLHPNTTPVLLDYHKLELHESIRNKKKNMCLILYFYVVLFFKHFSSIQFSWVVQNNLILLQNEKQNIAFPPFSFIQFHFI